MKRYAWAMFAVELWAHCARAQAQPEDALGGVLKIQSQAAPCLTESALRERVRHWLAPRAPAKGVTVVVDAGADPPAFRVWRGGAVIAVRRFASLPSACADRLDAIALPVALAIEQATEGNAAPDSAAPAAAAAAPSAPTGAASAASTPGKSVSATPDAPAEPGQAEVDAAGSAAADATATAAAALNPTEAVQEDAVARAADANEGADAAAKPEAEAEATAADSVVTESSSDTGAASRWRIFAGGSLLFEALPHTVVAVEAGPELLLGRHLSVSLGALVTAQTDHALGSVRSQAQVFGGRALLCAGWPLGGFGLDACAGAIGGAVAVNTKGTATGQTLAWLAGMARAALRFPVRSLISVRLGVSGLFNLVRPRLLASGAVPRSASAGVVGAETSIELLIALP